MERTATVVPEEDSFVLSSLPPSRAQKQLALAVAFVMVVIFLLASGPLSRTQTTPIAAFVPVYATALVLTEGITAFLLWSQFAILRTRALLVLSSGYLFTALMAVAWFLMFPGVFGPEGLIGGIQGRAYIYLFWHAGFPIFVTAYVLIKDAEPNKRYWHGTVRTAVVRSVVGTIAVVSALAFFVSVDYSILPRLELDPLRFSSLWVYFAVPMVALIILALLVLWVRRRSILDLWLMVVMCAYLMEIWLSYFPLAIAYGFGWYASRVFGFFSSSLVLWVLLYEITTLYARFLRAVLARHREREARLVTGDAVAATIAHEVKQPLTGMITNADAGLNWLVGPSPDIDEARVTFQQIIADGHRASAVIDSVRSMFKSEVRNRIWLDLDELIREALALSNSDLRRCQISIQPRLQRQLPRVKGDRIQILQVLLNLISNAIDSMAAANGSRTLRISAESHEGNGVLVSVADTGAGIDGSDIERIFNPLFTTKSGGMGMGLPICRSIIEAHEGRLTVIPNTPRGAVFQLFLPGGAATFPSVPFGALG